MRDWGVHVHPRFAESPLWKLSPSALRLWMYLAMMAQHPPQTMRLDDGQRVAVARGQWLTSTRRLQKALGVTSTRAIVADLAELRDASAISMQPITRSQSESRGVPNTRAGAFPNPRGRCVMATLVTVAGVEFRSDPVPTVGAKEEIQRETATPSSLYSDRDRRERAAVAAQLAAEGR